MGGQGVLGGDDGHCPVSMLEGMDPDQRREMEHHVLTCDGAIDEERVLEVAGNDSDSVPDLVANELQVREVGAGVVMHHGGDAGAESVQGLDEVASDEATRSRDEDTCSGQLHAVSP